MASSADEWIELQNQTASPIDLDGWRLTDGGDINVALSGTIPAHSYFLLERTDESTIADISASQIYTGSLANSGERLELLDSSGAIVDTANGDLFYPTIEKASSTTFDVTMNAATALTFIYSK